ncbi:MAG: hypothetical protein AAGJ82_07365, partial [Bacteroidota bacterium]
MPSSKKHIILQLTNEGAFYNETAFVAWADTNFPPKTSFSLNEREPVYWQVELLTYDKSTGSLSVEVVDYEAQPKAADFAQQTSKSPIRTLHFGTVNWRALQKVLNFYIRLDFEGIADFTTPAQPAPARRVSNPDWKRTTLTSRTAGQPEVSEVQKEDIKILFTYPLIKARFKMGVVEVKKRIGELGETVLIPLVNSHILPEFDHVKPYFAKLLEKKKITVSGKITFDEHNAMTIKCH